jgi:hypothetical protein
MTMQSMTMMALNVAMSLAVTSATFLVACGSAMAGETWLCSVASAVAVDEDGTVGPPELGDRERPTFFRVDAAKKELTLLAPDSRRGEVTKFDTATNADGLRVFSAVENDRGVSLIITPQGRMTLSIISDGVVWSVFGHALPEDAAK